MDFNILIGKGCRETDKDLFFGPAIILKLPKINVSFKTEDCLEDFVVKSTYFRVKTCHQCANKFKTDKWNEEKCFDKTHKIYIIRFRRDCSTVEQKCNSIDCSNTVDCGVYGLRLENAETFIEYKDDIPFYVLMRDLGIFKSSSQAKKNGWDKPIPNGWSDFKVGKKKTRICILKILNK